MKAVLYARVSTDDKDQEPETQLMALREYASKRDIKVIEEYVDYKSGRDMHRPNWKRMGVKA